MFESLHVLDTQKNRLDGTKIRKYSQFYAGIFCLSSMILCSVREDSNQTVHRVIMKLYFIEMLSCEFEHHIILDHRGLPY